MFALVRGISESFARAEVRHAPSSSIDVTLARTQHAAYVAALRALGLEIIELPPDHEHPDACFVEDCALVAGGVALIARLGAASRRGEERAVAAALARHLPLESMEAPATLDGGDCMRVGQRLFVGHSQRTNDAGIARARAVFEPRGLTVHVIEVGAELHLKSVCSPLDGRRILLSEGTLAPDQFPGCEVITVEGAAANVVAFRDAAVVPAGFASSRGRIETAGFRTIEVDTSETRKADGALTCMSVVF